MIGALTAGLPRRAVAALAVLGGAMLAAPLIAGDYLLSVLILALYFAYVGQAWNIMMGFAGQLSLGHSLYVGLGAYASAALFVHFGVPPWMGMVVGMMVAGAAGAVIGIDVFRYKMLAVVLSAAMTSLAGMFYAFYYNNLYPETIFSMHKSIELLLGVIVGGLGTLFGPIVGAVLLTSLGEIMTVVAETIDVDGIKQLFFGVCLAAIIIFRPEGVWPRLARWLGLVGRTDA